MSNKVRILCNYYVFFVNIHHSEVQIGGFGVT